MPLLRFSYRDERLYPTPSVLAYDPTEEVRDVRVGYGEGDVVEGVRVDPVVPVHHLLQRLPPLIDLRPVGVLNILTMMPLRPLPLLADYVEYT